MQKEQIVNRLRSEAVNLSFEKADGTVRHMFCTLRSDYLPESTATEQTLLTEEKNDNPDHVVVWDIEKAAWRSFKPSRVISFGEQVYREDLNG